MIVAMTCVWGMLVASSSDAVEEWKTLQASGMQLEVPVGWKQSLKGQTFTFTAPLEDASFELSIMPVEPVRTAKECFGQLKNALGKGWKIGKVGGLSAAMKASTDKSKRIVVETQQYVGCDGNVKWVLSWTYTLKEKKSYAPIAQRVFNSIRYGK